MAQTDRTCIICREDMAVVDHPKKLPCGHIFHFRCLRSWLERQQSCPTCRRDVVLDGRTDQAPRAHQAAPPGAAPGAGGAGGPAVNVPPPHAHAGQPGVPPPAQAPPPGYSTSPTPAAAVPGTATPSSNVNPPPPLISTTGSTPGGVPVGQHVPRIRLVPLFPHAPGTVPNIVLAPLGPPAPPPSSNSSSASSTTAPSAAGTSTLIRDDALTMLTDTQLRQLEAQSRQQLVERLRFLEQLRQQVDTMTAEVRTYLDTVTAEGQPGEQGSSASSS